MSLRVWLPLNGNLENKGLSNINITNNGSVVDNNGKIGKCYSFNDTYIQTDYNFYPGTGDFSISAWFYLTENTNKIYQHICSFKTTSAKSAGVAMIYNRSRQKFLWSTADGTTAQEIWSADTFPTSDIYNKWHHLVMIRDSNDSKHGYFYLNGVRKELASVPTILNITTNANTMKIGSCGALYTAYYWTGKINDFRIYDNALSPLEVKEISQGLVLHYPLNDFYNESTTNLAAGSAGKNYVTKEVAAYATSIKGKTQYENKIYTYSAYIKNTSDNPLAVRFNPYNADDSSYSAFNGNYIQPGCEGYSTVTVDISDTTKWNGKVILYVQNGNAGTVPTNKTFYIKEVQLEQKKFVTPYTDGTRIQTTISDCSGFGNDGTITGSLNYNSDSQRYNMSVHFDGSTYIHLTPPTAEIKTFSVWINWDSIPSGQSVILVDNGSQIGLGLMSTGILCSTSGAGNSYIFSKSGLVANTWYHFVVVETGTTTRKLYINGVEQSPTSNTSNWTYSVNELQLGKRSTTSDGFVGKLSDFRAYVTALSEADIKALYNTSANIDNLGNFHSFEFVENSNNLVNSDLTTWSKKSNVTCVFNSTTGFYDVDTHRDSSITSRWGIYKDIAIMPSTNYVFAVDMKDSNSKMYAGTYTSTPSGLPSSYGNVSSTTKRYYSYFTSGSSDTLCRLYLCATPSTNTVGHFVNPYFGVVSTNKSVEKNGIANFGNIVELNNEHARISQFGELGANEFIEK